MTIIIIALGIAAVLIGLVLYNNGFNAGYSVGHDDGFGHAKGWHLPPLENLKSQISNSKEDDDDFSAEVTALMEQQNREL